MLYPECTLIQNETVSFKKPKIKFWKMQYSSCLFCSFISKPPIPIFDREHTVRKRSYK